MTECQKKQTAVDWAWSKLHALLYNQADAKAILSELYSMAIDNHIESEKAKDGQSGKDDL